jgi:hypothetical protein
MDSIASAKSLRVVSSISLKSRLPVNSERRRRSRAATEFPDGVGPS